MSFAGAASCLGDVEIVAPEPGGDSVQEEVDPLQACTKGEIRCNGAWLESCGDGANGTTRWNKNEECDSPALCDDDLGSCGTSPCASDRARCNGAVPQLCSYDLTEWRDVEGECISAGHCSLDTAACNAESKQAPCCLQAPCEAGELRCNGSQLERCRADRLGHDPALPAPCDTPLLCERALDACEGAGPCECTPAVCEPNQKQCVGTTLQRCSADQTTWETIDECATAELCQEAAAPGVAEAACREPCAVGEFRCDGAVLSQCNQGRTGFDQVKTCSPGNICSTMAGDCVDTCEPTERRCAGAQIEQCAASLVAFEPAPGPQNVCVTPELCIGNDPVGSARCETPACNANEFRCQNTQLVQCNVGQTALLPVGPPCPRADLCSAARGRCDFCVPNRQECTGDLTTRRTCAADGNSFINASPCPLGCIPASGTCVTCEIGSYRCSNGLLSRCDDGISFTPLNRGSDCSGNNTQVTTCGGAGNNVVQTSPCALGCNTGRNACNQCTGNMRRCADGSGNSFQVCQANGTFGAAQACGTGLDCRGAGVCGCDPGEAACDGNDVIECNLSGTNFLFGAVCSGPERRTCANGVLTSVTCGSVGLCASGTGAACGACVNGERSCSSGTNPQPIVCASGQFQPAPSCDAGFACEGAGLCRCTVGELRCVDGVVAACDETRTAFAPAPRCAEEVLRGCDVLGNVVQTNCGTPALCEASTGNVCAE